MRPRKQRLFAALLGVGFALSVVQLATAHEKRAARRGMVTVRAAEAGVELDLLVFLRFAGPRATGFLARYDLNHDGQLDPGEGKLLADALSPEALGGLVLRQGARALRPQRAEARARRDRDAIEIAVLVSWTADLAQGKIFAVTEREGRTGQPATVLQVRATAMAPLKLSSSGVPEKDGVIGPVTVHTGDRGLVFEVVTPPVPATL